jgi:hypothetical protein
MIMECSDNKNSEKLSGTSAKSLYFPQKMPEITRDVLVNTPDRYREGGRTVGSGRVATVIE